MSNKPTAAIPSSGPNHNYGREAILASFVARGVQYGSRCTRPLLR